LVHGFKKGGKFHPTGIRRNPKFKRVARFGTIEFEAEQKKSNELAKKSAEKFREAKQRKIGEEKERRFQARPKNAQGQPFTLAELTDKFIMEGDSEDDAFQEAKNTLGIR